MLSETVRADLPRGRLSAAPLGDIAKAHPDVMIGSYPFQDDGRSQHQHRAALARCRRSSPPPRPRSRRCWRRCARGCDIGLSVRPMQRWQTTPARQAASPEKAFPVSWDQFHRDARALAWRLAAAGPFEAIVAITRGGLVPAAIVARELNIRLIETVASRATRLHEPGRAAGCSRASPNPSSSAAARAC